jgi:hypothetical protein
MELEQLEKRLQDASRLRENRLRKAGPSGRVQMAIQVGGSVFPPGVSFPAQIMDCSLVQRPEIL